jgi:hypothetical protein
VRAAKLSHNFLFQRQSIPSDLFHLSKKFFLLEIFTIKGEINFTGENENLGIANGSKLIVKN